LYGDEAVISLVLLVSRHDITGVLFAVRYQTEIYDAYKRIEVTKNALSIPIMAS
jgi:hypothetical protein